MDEIDLRAAVNAISDVIQNRPRPLREFDQIYMKAGDMVMQSQFVANWANGKRLAFIGDGDAISVCVAYLGVREILPYGPSRVTVFDFDERIVNAVRRFADRERIETLDAQLYNCLDQLPGDQNYDAFYTNPPWGASNDGNSVNLFVQRGIESINYSGEGCVVIADDAELGWTQDVLANVQAYSAARGFFVSRMMPRLHTYHLDDAPDLRSCNLIVQSRPDTVPAGASKPVSDPQLLAHFYGQDQQPHVHYVRERTRVDYGKALDLEYEFELFADEAD